MQPPDMETLSIECDGGIATLFFDRPDKRNAMNHKMFQELEYAADYLRDNAEIKVVIMTGRGSAFSAGLDLGDAERLMGTDVTSFRVMLRGFQRNFRAFELIEKPVIAMVNGPALGAGTEIALACDMILCSTEAVFGLLEVSIGLVTDLGATQRLPRFVGIHKAKELILTGKRIDASEAMRIGLVNAVYPSEKLKDETVSLAKHFASLPTLAVGLCKIAIDRSRDGSIESGLEYEVEAQSICLASIIEKSKEALQGEQ